MVEVYVRYRKTDIKTKIMELRKYLLFDNCIPIAELLNTTIPIFQYVQLEVYKPTVLTLNHFSSAALPSELCGLIVQMSSKASSVVPLAVANLLTQHYNKVSKLLRMRIFNISPIDLIDNLINIKNK